MRRPARKNKTLGMLLNLGITALFALCCVAAYNVIKPLADYKNGGEAYGDVAQLALKKASARFPGETGGAAIENGSFKEPPQNNPGENIIGETFAVDFEYLKTVSGDIRAWIYIPGTPVNYPVMQGGDNEYYLKRLYNGRLNSMGSIFIDAGNSGDFSDRNTVIHGHNMKNGSMFASLLKYRDQSFYDAHKEITLFTETGEYALEILSAYTTSSDGPGYKTSFAGDDEFESFVEKIKDISDFISSAEYDPGDRLITLSTCTTTGGYSEYRYVVHALIKSPD